MSGDLPPGVVEFNGGAQPRFNTRPPVPPVHPMPQPQARAPGSIPFGMAPAGMGPANQAVMSGGLPPTFPPPPHHAVPRDLRSRQTVEISDIRNERLTEADALERLSSYVVLRLEKADISNDFDELSHPTRFSWEKILQVEQSGISKQEAARQVASLDRETKSVLEKKAALSGTIQRQLEVAGEKLARTDSDPRYHYILVQFESKLRKLETRQAEYASRSKRERKYNNKHSKKEKSKPKYERVSITAYFKRIPKPGQSCKRMLEERERDREIEQHMSEQMSLPSPTQHMPMHIPAHMPTHFPPVAQPMGGAPIAHGAPVNPVPSAMPKPDFQDKPMKPIQQDKEEKNVKPGNQGVQMKHLNQEKPDRQTSSGKDNQNKPSGQGKPVTEIASNGKRSQGYHGSPRSSRSSLSSEASFMTNESDFITPQSSIGSSSRSSKLARGRTLVRHEQQGQPEHYGVDPLRQHTKDEPDYVLDRQPARRPLSPAFPFAENLGSPREEEPMRQRQAHYPSRFEDEDSMRPRTLPPRIIQRGVRRVAPFEAKREIRSDLIDRVGSRLERLRLEDIAKHERRLRFDHDDEFVRLPEDIRQRRGLQARLRGRGADGYMPMEREDRWPEPEARTYMASRERPIGMDSSRPISSMARRGGVPREHYI
ncbi:Fc.00g077230.m01.CDS01 [Cosmosporella sp. VM-42]